MSCFCCIMGTLEILWWKINQKSYRNCLFKSLSCRMWAMPGEISEEGEAFLKIYFVLKTK